MWPYLADTVPGGAAGLESLTVLRPEDAAEVYVFWLIEQPALMITLKERLSGADLACACPLPKPNQPDHCHRSILLKMANDVA